MENNGYDWDIMIFQNEELPVGCSWGNMQEEAAYYDSGSPDGGATATSSSVVTNNNNKNNIVLERNRRNKLKDRLHALRAAVPKISKMDRASIIKDAIEYIYQLQEQEKIIQAEILELESSANKLKNPIIYDQEDLPILLRSKKKRTTTDHHHGLIFDNHYYSPIQIIELRVKYMGGKMFMVNLTCSKRTDTMVKLSEVFESLKLKVITAHITSSSATLLNTVFIQADEEEKDFLEIKIHTAISALNDPQSPMSI